MVDCGHRVAGAPKFVEVTPNYFWALSMELVACHASGGYDFGATLRLLENLGTASIHTRARVCVYIYIYIYIYRVSQEECARLQEGVPYVKVYRYNPINLCPKWNGYGVNGQRSLKL